MNFPSPVAPQRYRDAAIGPGRGVSARRVVLVHRRGMAV